MPLNFKATFDTVDYGLPLNWRELQYTYDFNGSDTFLTDVSGTMTFCNSSFYTAMRAKVKEAICGVVSLQWQVICSPLVPTFTELFTGNIRRSDFEFTCGSPPCQTDITAEQYNAYTVLEANNSTQVAIACGNVAANGDSANSKIIPVHQMQTGAYYKEGVTSTEKTFCFLRVEDLIDEMIQRLGWTGGGTSPLVSGILTRPFLTDNRKIEVANASDAGSTISIFLEYHTGFQKTSIINVNASDTVASIRILIQKAILAIQGYGVQGINTFSPQWNEFQFQPAEVVFAADGNPELRSDHPIKTLTVTGGNSGAYTVTQTQAYQYGLRDLLVSVNGMTSGSITTNWQEIKNLLSKVHPMVYSNNSQNGVQIQSYADSFNGRTPGTPSTGIFGTAQNTTISPDAGKVKAVVRKEILNSRAIFGQRWAIMDKQDCLNSWKWEGISTPIPTLVGQNNNSNAGERATPWQAFITPTSSGTYTFAGNVTFGGAAGVTTGVTWFLTDGDGTGAYNIIAGGTIVNVSNGDVRSAVQLFAGATFCLEAGTTYYLRWISTAANLVVVAGGSDLELRLTTADATFPYITDDTSHLNDPYTRLLLFQNCDGVYDREIEDNTYAGIGFALDQQINECADYGDALFLTFLDTTTNKSQRFPRSMYFPEVDSNVPACYRGQNVIYYYHNSPLQWPQIAYEFRAFLPSAIQTNKYTHAVTLTSTGPGSEPTIDSFVRSNFQPQGNQIDPAHNRTHLYTFSNCQTIIQALSRTLDRSVTFVNCLDGTNTTGIIRKMATRFDGQGSVSFEVEANAPTT